MISWAECCKRFKNIKGGFCHRDSYCGEQDVRVAQCKGKSVHIELLAPAHMSKYVKH